MTIRNASGKKLGEIKDRSDGQIALDAGGRKLGDYNERTDITRDAHGRTVGHGNLLAGLIYDNE